MAGILDNRALYSRNDWLVSGIFISIIGHLLIAAIFQLKPPEKLRISDQKVISVTLLNMNSLEASQETNLDNSNEQETAKPAEAFINKIIPQKAEAKPETTKAKTKITIPSSKEVIKPKSLANNNQAAPDKAIYRQAETPQRKNISDIYQHQHNRLNEPPRMESSPTHVMAQVPHNTIRQRTGSGISGISPTEGYNMKAAVNIIENPVPRYRVSPEYPVRAVKQGWQGIAIVEAIIDDLGSTKNLKIHKSSGYPLLDKAAIDAVEKWKFDISSSRHIKNIVRVPVKFLLSGNV